MSRKVECSSLLCNECPNPTSPEPLVSISPPPFNLKSSTPSLPHLLSPYSQIQNMSPDTWLLKLKSAISHKLIIHNNPSSKSNSLGVIAFEASGLISKLLHLYHHLLDENMTRLRNQSICLEGVRKIVSNDDVFLLGLACAELVDSLRSISNSIARFSFSCNDPNLRAFDRVLCGFAETGKDLYNWVLSGKDVDARVRQMERYVVATTSLRKEMDQLVQLEAALRKAVKMDQVDQGHGVGSMDDLQHKISWQRKQVKYFKEKSLWNRSFDSVTLCLVRFVFTVLARIKLVFGIGQGHPMALPRSLSASAAVCPSSSMNFTIPGALEKGRHESFKGLIISNGLSAGCGFFDMNSRLLKPPSTTLETAGLALHYANLIIVIEKMIRYPHLVGMDARDDLYAMLPQSVRSSLRSRLKGVGFAAGDPVLAAEWSDALGRILGWLLPLALKMIKWQSERSFEQHNNQQAQKTNVLLFQTLYFANKEKAEAAITELLVGLNYIWRFERELNLVKSYCSNAQTTNIAAN